MSREIILAGDNSITTQKPIEEKIFEKWINYNKKQNRTPATVRTYEKVLRIFFSWANENSVNLQALNADIVNSFIQALKTRRNINTGETISVRTLRLYVAALRVFVKFAAKENFCKDFTEDIARISLKGIDTLHARNSLSEKQAKALLGTVRKDAADKKFIASEEKVFQKTAARKNEESARNAAIIALMLFGGLRAVEICRLELVNLKGNKLFVQGKGHASADTYVKIPSNVIKLIKTYLSVRQAGSGVTSLFTSCSRRCRGQQLQPQTVNNVVKRYLIDAGIIDGTFQTVEVVIGGKKKTIRRRRNDISGNKLDFYKTSSHSLRHFCACQQIRKNVPIEYIRQNLRHTSLSVTTIYIADIDKEKNDGLEQISLDFFD